MTRLPRFDLHAPETVEEATGLLDYYRGNAALYAGGTELLLLMKLGFASFSHLVDVKGLSELGGIALAGEALRIGATVTHRELERSSLIHERWPALVELERSVANLRVREAGTLGGNICFSDPHSDPATFLLTAEAELEVRHGKVDVRRIAADEFFLGPYRTALLPGELLAAVYLPDAPPGSVTVHRKLSFRERPAATVTCLVRVENGRLVEARVAVGSVGPIPVRATEAENLLSGAQPEKNALEAAALAAATACAAVDDANGSAEYKRQLVRVLVTRTLTEAVTHGAMRQ